MVDASLTPLRARVEARRAEIKATAARHRGRAVAVFGAVARQDLVRMQDDLAALLDQQVDVVSLGGLEDRDHGILEDAVWL